MSQKISSNYNRLLDSIAEEASKCGRTRQEIELVAVTKNHSAEEVLSLYEAGCRLFGENRLQEALPKVASLPPDCDWHMIGTLQKNKVRKAVEAFAMIESVDTAELATKISVVSCELGIVTPILLEVNVSQESSKHGLSVYGWKSAYEGLCDLPGICLEGLMTMAPFTEDRAFIRRCFAQLRKLREELPGIGQHLSMGMSHDYVEAIAEGSTILRVGSRLFL